MRKILFINYEFPPLGGGGGHASAHIARRLAAMGHDVTVMTSRFKTLPKNEIWEGVRVWRIPTLRHHLEKCSILEMAVFLLMSLVYALWYHLRKKPDVVVAFFSIPSGPAALLLNLIFKTPYVIALRGGDVPGFLPEQLEFFHRLTNWLTLMIWRRAHCVTVNSEGLGKLAKEFFPGVNLCVIPNGVEDDFFYDRISTHAENPPKVLRLLTVGRLSRQKKNERQIEAMGRLMRRGETAVLLTIVGDGPERKNLEAVARDNAVLNVTVFFVGWCPRSRIGEYYRQADVFCLSSDFEGMPNVILEAMAASLAIVATDAPGTVDLVIPGRNGYLVQGSSADFDQFIMALKNSPDELLRMQKYSRELASHYTWDGVAKAYADVCEKAVSK